MALRGGTSIDLIWVHVDLAHSRASTLLQRAADRITQRLPGVTLSINRNIAGTQALVKIVGLPAEFTASLPGNVRPAIIRIFTEADHAEALAMVSTLEWTGPPEVV